jgi:hypothetical protein
LSVFLGLFGRGIRLRDIKPQNLFLVGGGVKVGDLGLARRLERSVAPHTGSMTLAYAPPEFFQGQVAQTSDQYSLAVTYCLLRGGRLPFAGSPAQVVHGHLHRAPNLTMLPPPERPAVARALAKRPRDRWPSCARFAEAIESSPASLRRPTRWGPRLSVVAALLLAATALGFLYWVTAARNSQDPAPAAEPGREAQDQGPRPVGQPNDQGSGQDKGQGPGPLRPGEFVNAIGMHLVEIPAGAFWMGTPADAAERQPDEVWHQVEITSRFHIGVYEVTQRQYRSVMKQNPSYFSSSGKGRKLVKAWIPTTSLWSASRGKRRKSSAVPCQGWPLRKKLADRTACPRKRSGSTPAVARTRGRATCLSTSG